MNNNELELLKDKYVMGTLSEDESADLEVELLQNPKLEEELRIHKDIAKGLNYAGELELKEMLDKIHYQQAKITLPNKNRSIKFYLIASLLVIVAIIFYFFLSGNTKDSINPNHIYAEFYSPYKPSLQDRGENEYQAISQFNMAYVARDYNEAINIIKPFLGQSNNNIKLTAAIAANEIDDLLLAEGLLDQIIETNDFYFNDHAIWYKALIQLKTKDTQTVRETLTPILVNLKADHHSEAKELIGKL